jgi:hypothetical protein
MNTLYLFREISGGKRERWKFSVDERQTIVREEPCPEVEPPIETAATRDERGHRVVATISADDRRILTFFSPTAPCWFPRCAELREKYQAEINALDAGCPSCQKGAVIRKYQALVKKYESTPQSDPAGEKVHDTRT